MTDKLYPDTVNYDLVLTAIVQRFVRLVGAPVAVTVARRIPRLSVDDNGRVQDYDRDDPLATVTALVDAYGTIFGDIAVALAEQAAPAFAEPFASAPGGTRVSPGQTLAGPLTVLIIENHALLREGLVALVSTQPDLRVAGEAGTLREGLRLVENCKPGMVLLGFDFPDGRGVCPAAASILARSPQIPIVFVVTQEDDERILDAVRAGAVGFIPKDAGPNQIVHIVRAVGRGEAGISRKIARVLLREISQPPNGDGRGVRDHALRPTARETEILRAPLTLGATNREIAQKYLISENTVKNHVRNVLAKLGLHSRRDLADYARRWGLTDPPHGEHDPLASQP